MSISLYPVLPQRPGQAKADYSPSLGTFPSLRKLDEWLRESLTHIQDGDVLDKSQTQLKLLVQNRKMRRVDAVVDNDLNPVVRSYRLDGQFSIDDDTPETEAERILREQPHLMMLTSEYLDLSAWEARVKDVFSPNDDHIDAAFRLHDQQVENLRAFNASGYTLSDDVNASIIELQEQLSEFECTVTLRKGVVHLSCMDGRRQTILEPIAEDLMELHVDICGKLTLDPERTILQFTPDDHVLVSSCENGEQKNARIHVGTLCSQILERRTTLEMQTG